MMPKNKKNQREPFLLWLPKGDRLKLRVELLKQGQTVTGHLRKEIRKIIDGEDTIVSTK